jgi:hypothetical protein
VGAAPGRRAAAPPGGQTLTARDPYAQLKDVAWRELAEIDAQLERGEIDDEGWHCLWIDSRA